MKATRPRIHIIANCANRKRVPPVAELKSISLTDIEDRAASWWVKLNNFSAEALNNKNLFREADCKIKARNLYVGSYWATIRALPEKAEAADFDTNLWVVSAGYGLISSEDQIHSYSATFTPGNENSVTNGEKDSINRNKLLKQWWDEISRFSLLSSSNPRKISHLIRENPDDYFLIVASADYLSAIEDDLLTGISALSSPNNIVIISSKSFSNAKLQNNIILTDARLQCNGNCAENCEDHLIPRGVRGAIGASLAATIIERAREDGFNAHILKQFVEKRIKESPDLVGFNRTRLEDDEVRQFIIQGLKESSLASCTHLLRKLRADGLACEQKRFKSIYWIEKGRMT